MRIWYIGRSFFISLISAWKDIRWINRRHSFSVRSFSWLRLLSNHLNRLLRLRITLVVGILLLIFLHGLLKNSRITSPSTIHSFLLRDLIISNYDWRIARVYLKAVLRTVTLYVWFVINWTQAKIVHYICIWFCRIWWNYHLV